jgi:predicted nucleic acid-binding protein
MPDRTFFDTNVLIYALMQEDRRTVRVEQLLLAGGLISVQVLNEFASVARRKLKMPWRDVNAALQSIRTLCPSPAAITLPTHDLALKITGRYRYEIYDALIIASALQSKCTVLLSEDLQHEQVIDNRLTIRNPFL